MNNTPRLKSTNQVYDETGKLIGKYVYLQEGDQEMLDSFCEAWLRTYQEDNRFFLTLDLETSGLKPHEGEILLFSLSWDGKHSVIFCPAMFDLNSFCQVLETVPISNQNIKFDAKWILHHLGIMINIYFDTMVGAQLAWAGAFPENSFGLGNLAKQLLDGLVLEKETRKEFIGKTIADGFTEEQIAYAVKDSLITHRLVAPIVKRLCNQGLWEIWEEIERPLIEIFTRTEVYGLKVDREGISEMLTIKEKELAEQYKEIEEELLKIDNLPKFPKNKAGKEQFNPGSSQQIITVLQCLGLKPRDTQKATLEMEMAKNPHPLLEKILDWKQTKGIISKFLTKWLEEHIDDHTDCLYPTFNTYGSETGRLCVDGETLIETNEGQIPIKSLENFESKKVIAHTKELQKIVNFFYKGKEEMFEVTLETGQRIICTKGHIFKTPNGWEQLKNLEIGSSIWCYGT